MCLMTNCHRLQHNPDGKRIAAWGISNFRPYAQWKALINELHPVSIFPNSVGSLELSSSESRLLAGKGHEVSPEKTETDGLSYALKSQRSFTLRLTGSISKS